MSINSISWTFLDYLLLTDGNIIHQPGMLRRMRLWNLHFHLRPVHHPSLTTSAASSLLGMPKGGEKGWPGLMGGRFFWGNPQKRWVLVRKSTPFCSVFPGLVKWWFTQNPFKIHGWESVQRIRTCTYWCPTFRCTRRYSKVLSIIKDCLEASTRILALDQDMQQNKVSWIMIMNISWVAFKTPSTEVRLAAKTAAGCEVCSAVFTVVLGRRASCSLR